MAKFVLTMSYEEFVKAIRPPTSVATLKKLLIGLYDIKMKLYAELRKDINEYSTKVIKNYKEDPRLIDIERKETAIIRELQINRGIDTKGEDFYRWYKKLRNRATKPVIIIPNIKLK